MKKRNIKLAEGFAEKLRQYAKGYKKMHAVNLSEIYSMLSCSKQNVSYWEIHCDSTQSANSIRRVVHSAREFFGLNDDEAEELANSAGLSLYFEGGSLIETLKYQGKICELSANALISERMLRHYKKNPDQASSYGDFAISESESWRAANYS